MKTLAVGSAIAIVASMMAMTAAPAAAGENDSLCGSTSGAQIPSNFMIDVCYDGSNIVLENHSSLVLRANTSPYVAPPTRAPSGVINTLLSQTMIDIDGRNAHPDPYLLPPETRLTIPVGAAGNQLSVELWSHQDLYGLAEIVSLIPFGPSQAKDFADLINNLGKVFRSYQDCMSHTNFLGKIGCVASAVNSAVETIKETTARLVLDFAPGKVAKLVGQLLAFVDGGSAVADQAGDLARFASSDHSISVAGSAATPPPTKPDAGPDATPPPPTVSTDVITPPPLPVGQQTFPETAGGVTHTWTNYTNAGGNEGQQIPKGTTVLIACKLPGFTVADGNTWWYRIAQAPWNNTFYASADAFYNNGQTSGSLAGTPFVDGSVADC